MGEGSMSRPSPVSLPNSPSCCRATSVFLQYQRPTMTVELGARPTTPRSCDHDNRLRRYRDTQDRGETGTGGTTATILVVDDEPDLEKLVTRKFRRQIRERLISFVFARDGLEAL